VHVRHARRRFGSYLHTLNRSYRPLRVKLVYVIDQQTAHWLSPKTQVFYKNRDMLDPAKFLSYIYPYPEPLQPISDSPLAYDPPSAPIPGYPANPRMLLIRLYLQLGVFMNYYLGEHEINLHEHLHGIIQENLEEDHESLLKIILPAHHHCLLPQVGVTSSWPPTFLMHGSADTVVPMQESRHIYELLQCAGVQVYLEIASECEHSYDLDVDAGRVHGPTFDKALKFLHSCLSNST
jgi:acetyl esterase/lipase